MSQHNLCCHVSGLAYRQSVLQTYEIHITVVPPVFTELAQVGFSLTRSDLKVAENSWGSYF